MVQWMKAKRAVLIIGLVAVVATLGAGGVAAAHVHSGHSPGMENQDMLGTIQSVNSTKQVFVLFPDGKKSQEPIAFDANTTIEGGQATLKAGVHVRVEVLNRADGSLYATEVKRSPTSQGNDDGVDDHEQVGGDHEVNDAPGQHAQPDGLDDGVDDAGSDG
jgi:Domain of unknown function (DUF5666)